MQEFIKAVIGAFGNEHLRRFANLEEKEHSVSLMENRGSNVSLEPVILSTSRGTSVSRTKWEVTEGPVNMERQYLKPFATRLYTYVMCTLYTQAL